MTLIIKTKLGLLGLLAFFSLDARADHFVSMAPAEALTLGIADGIYDGGGPLIPSDHLIPAMSFTSHRNIHGGIVEAQSKAYLLGFPAASVTARLKFQAIEGSPNNYDVLDMDQDLKKVGSASCNSSHCQFEAVVMNGEFTLKETWTPAQHGFELSSGFQIYKKTPSHYSGSFEVEGASYNEIKKMVFASPLQKLPIWPGIDPAQVLDAFFLRSGEIVDRSHATFDSSSDFRPARMKLLHPVGVCAEAEWEVTQSSPATGLFKKGTRIPALFRFSTGTADSVYSKGGVQRIFGLAGKLFPTIDPNKRVETVNIQMLDRYGFDRTPRKRTFYEDEATDGTSEPVYFTNVAPAKSAFGKALATFFDRFDKPNFTRPVYPLAQVEQNGAEVSKVLSPYEIRLIPHFKPRPQPSDSERLDFRDEIRSYAPGEIVLDIVIQNIEPQGTETALQSATLTVGHITLGKSVVSDACDLNLHFHHPLNRFRQVFPGYSES